MEIIKSKRKGSVCQYCHQKINGKYKVKVRTGWGGNLNSYYHLSCYLNRLKVRLVVIKDHIKQFSKIKYKKQMILEKL